MKIRFSRHTQLYIIIVLCFILLSFVSVVNCEANETEPEPAPVEYATKEEFNQLVTDSNHAWLIFGSALVFIMQAGFAFLEAGGVRKKSLMNILLKNLVDSCVGSLVFYAVGFGIAYGDDPTSKTRNVFVGNSGFLMQDYDNWAFFIFQASFAATASTIVSGAVAERCHFHAYLIFSMICVGWTYPCVVHWMWSAQGFLCPFNTEMKRIGKNGAFDFAGDAAVHLVGGVSALVAAIILGPRHGRYDPSRADEFKSHSEPKMVLGVFILWFGWFGFNCASTITIYGYGNVAGKVAVTTTLAASAAALTCLIIGYLYTKQLQIGWCMNGILAGLVAITGPCAVVQPYAAIIIGFIGAFCYMFASFAMQWLRIDDPLDAVAVHAACGSWGIIASGFFAHPDNMKAAYGISNPTSYGLFEGGGVEQLGIQLLALVIVVSWTAICAVLGFTLLHFTVGYRVPLEYELQGIDNAMHAQHEEDEKDLV